MKTKIFGVGCALTFGLPVALAEPLPWRIASFLLLDLVSCAATLDRYKVSNFQDTAIATTTPAQKRDRVQDIDTKQSTIRLVKPNYTGVVKRVDAIAQQITVRIEATESRKGSGVIIAREGDTYYVATAAHVVQTNDGEKIAVILITPTQEQIGLQAGDINVVNKDLGVAIVKFKSKQNYRIADISKYEFNKSDWVFVSGFPGKDTSKQRYLSIGTVKNREETEFRVKERGSLTQGNNLIYTNLSLPGMSGGAVLDRQGRLVGINTGAENQGISTQDGKNYEEINFGFALGIPISTVIGVASQSQLPTFQLQVKNTSASEPSQSESEEIQAILLSTLSKPNQIATAKELLDYANLLWRCDKYRESVTTFKTAIKLLERHPEIQDRKEQLRTAYFGLGLAWWSNRQGSRQQNFQTAMVAFQQAEKVDPGFYQSSRYLGSSLEQLKRYDEALTAYQRAISTQKADFVLYVEQGDVLQQMKRYREAIDSYNLAVKLQPNHPWIYNNRGTTYYNLKQYPQAIADYSQAIQLNPQYADAYFNRGNAYIDLKQYPQMLADYSQAIQLKPQLTDAYNNRGNAYKELKQYDRAIADYNQAIQLNPQDAKTYYNRGSAYNALKQYPQAIADYSRAIQLKPQLADAYNNRGIAYKELKQHPQAIADYNQAIQLNPQDAGAYGNRGIAYKELKQYPQAIADYNQAIQLNPQDAGAYGNRGLVYAKQKQYPQAKADLTKAAELFRAQNNTAGYQRAMELLQQLRSIDGVVK